MPYQAVAVPYPPLTHALRQLRMFKEDQHLRHAPCVTSHPNPQIIDIVVVVVSLVMEIIYLQVRGEYGRMVLGHTVVLGYSVAANHTVVLGHTLSSHALAAVMAGRPYSM